MLNAFIYICYVQRILVIYTRIQYMKYCEGHLLIH